MVAPGDRGTQGLLASRHIACTAGQDFEAMREARQQGLRGIQPHACSSQFDGQGKPVQVNTDLRNGTSVRFGQLEIGLDGLRALDEEGAGSIVRKIVPCREVVQIR